MRYFWRRINAFVHVNAQKVLHGIALYCTVYSRLAPAHYTGPRGALAAVLTQSNTSAILCLLYLAFVSEAFAAVRAHACEAFCSCSHPKQMCLVQCSSCLLSREAFAAVLAQLKQMCPLMQCSASYLAFACS